MGYRVCIQNETLEAKYQLLAFERIWKIAPKHVPNQVTGTFNSGTLYLGQVEGTTYTLYLRYYYPALLPLLDQDRTLSTSSQVMYLRLTFFETMNNGYELLGLDKKVYICCRKFKQFFAESPTLLTSKMQTSSWLKQLTYMGGTI